MTPTQITSLELEQRSLTTAKWANLVMGLSGVAAAWYSRSDALLVDGLFSAVNFISAIVAGRVGISLTRRPSLRRPFGYDADEAIYVTFRSMVLAGVIAFAAFAAISKIIAFANGETIPDLRFGIIILYTCAMVVICGGLALLHHANWRKSGRQSEILRTEISAAIIDAVMSAGAGLALSLVPLLVGTMLEPYIPIADAVIVMILCLFIIGSPITQFRQALGELSGMSAGAEAYKKARRVAGKLADEAECQLVQVTLTKLGRSYFLVAYINPDRATTAVELDRLNSKLKDMGKKVFGKLQTEIIVTERKRIGRP